MRVSFQNTDNFGICRQITNEVEAALMSNRDVQNPEKQGSAAISISELYNRIAKTGLKATEIEKAVLDKIKIDASVIPSLDMDLVDPKTFSATEWNRICLFEYHFSKEFNVDSFSSYEEGIKRRWDFFLAIQQSNVSAQRRVNLCNKLLRNKCRERQQLKLVEAFK